MTTVMMSLSVEFKSGFNSMSERIGVFGGAFDPVHNGHISIALSFLKSNVVHRLLILPTPDPPHKKKDSLTSFQHRLRMLEIAFKDMEKVTVSELENRLPSPSYSLQTINHLQKINPSAVYYLCIGEDSLESFNSWYKYREVLKKSCLLVAERPGYHASKISDDILERAIFVDHHPIAISSTEIRNHTGKRNTLYQLSIPDEVREYIAGNNLYRN